MPPAMQRWTLTAQLPVAQLPEVRGGPVGLWAAGFSIVVAFEP